MRARIESEGSTADACRQSNFFAIEAIRKAKPDVVIVGQNGNHDPRRMIELRDRLVAAGVGKVIFTGPVPHWTGRLFQLITFRMWESTPQRTFSGLDRESLRADVELKQALGDRPGLTYVSIIDYFCNRDGCLTRLGDDKKLGITTYDYGHLSLMASDALARDVLIPLIVGKRPSP